MSNNTVATALRRVDALEAADTFQKQQYEDEAVALNAISTILVRQNRSLFGPQDMKAFHSMVAILRAIPNHVDGSSQVADASQFNESKVLDAVEQAVNGEVA